jgi:hypothetical protein
VNWSFLIATGVGIPLFWVLGGRCPAMIPRRVSYSATGDCIELWRLWSSNAAATAVMNCYEFGFWELVNPSLNLGLQEHLFLELVRGHARVICPGT